MEKVRRRSRQSTSTPLFLHFATLQKQPSKVEQNNKDEQPDQTYVESLRFYS
jgi:hypothetical protein